MNTTSKLTRVLLRCLNHLHPSSVCRLESSIYCDMADRNEPFALVVVTSAWLLCCRPHSTCTKAISSKTTDYAKHTNSTCIVPYAYLEQQPIHASLRRVRRLRSVRALHTCHSATSIASPNAHNQTSCLRPSLFANKASRAFAHPGRRDCSSPNRGTVTLLQLPSADSKRLSYFY
jgi:hypothetical protein